MDATVEFDRIAEDLAGRGVVTGSLFGKRGLKAGGKAFACLLEDTFAVKLGAGTPEHDRALALPGAELFDPSGKHRPFKDWVAVPAARAEEWAGLAEVGLARCAES